MNALIRTTFLVATIAAISFALVQVVGRVVSWQLPRLEGVVNDVLASQGVAVRGIQGRWNGINPGLYADRIEMPAGQASGLDFELDLLESLGRNRVVARRLTVADGHVALDKTPTGWQLRGASGADGFDVQALLTHSDEVWLRGRIGFYGPDHGGSVHVESMLINQDGNHRFHIGLRPDTSCAECVLTIDGDITEDGPGQYALPASQSCSPGTSSTWPALVRCSPARMRSVSRSISALTGVARRTAKNTADSTWPSTSRASRAPTRAWGSRPKPGTRAPWGTAAESTP